MLGANKRVDNMDFFNHKIFKYTLIFLIFLELLSFFGWLLPDFNTICFFIILLITLILSLEKLEYGVLILLAELFVGSKGYLFSLEAGETVISIRMGLFVVVMGVWLLKFILRIPVTLAQSQEVLRREGSLKSSNSLLTRINIIIQGIPRFIRNILAALAIVILWAFVWGLVRGNNFGNVFLDFNNWLYFLLIFPVFYCLGGASNIFAKSASLSQNNAGSCKCGTEQCRKFIKNILSVLTAAVLWLGIKSLILLYIFSHEFVWALPEVYRWVRDTGIGEITQMDHNFYRIFMQSQIYSLFLFFILIPISNFKFPSRAPGSSFQTKFKFQIPKSSNYWLLVTGHWLLVLCLTTIILSFSRSYWVALIIVLLLYYFIIIFLLKTKFLKVIKNFAKILVMVGISLVIIFTVINLPPKSSAEDLASLISKRVTRTEAAGSSRLSMLGPLLKEIIKHPVIGSGFGTTVTYTSYDPRILAVTAGQSGEFTTYAFEWAYLDMILKFGLAGVAIYLLLIYNILRRLANFKFLISNFQTNAKSQTLKSNNYWLLVTGYWLRLGFLLALVSLLVVNIFSPYLNHPLGIGFIILSSLIAANSEPLGQIAGHEFVIGKNS